MIFNKEIDKYKNDIIKATRDLVMIPTVKKAPKEGCPFGNDVARGLNYVLDLAESLGYTTKNLDGLCGYAEYGTGELYIGIFGHVDVAYENEKEWEHNPYGAEVDNDKMYGSGVVDKGALIASLYAIKAIIDSNKTMERKIRIIIGTDNRLGYLDMKHYLSKENPPLAGIAIDGYFPVTYAEVAVAMMKYETEINLKGEEHIEYITGGKAVNVVPDYCRAKIITERKNLDEKIRCFAEDNQFEVNTTVFEEGIILETYGISRHSAYIDSGVNAVIVMLQVLQFINIGNQKFKEIVRYLYEIFGVDYRGKTIGIAYKDSFSGELTMNLGEINLENNLLSVSFDGRFPVTCNYRKAMEEIDKSMISYGFLKKECNYWPPIYFHRDNFLIKALLESYKEVTKEEGEPYCSRTASYAVGIPNIAAFGAAVPGRIPHWDSKDEFIGIEELHRTSKIYASAIYRMCNDI